MLKKILTPLALVLVVLLAGMLLIAASGANPLDAYKMMFRAAFGSVNGMAEVLVKATPLILAGLGVAVAFRTGFFNIGAEGQLYMGGLAATTVALFLPGVPGFLRVVPAVLAAFVAGGVWAFLPALLKSTLGISETINTIMFNYIALMIVGIAIRGPLQDTTDYQPQSMLIGESGTLPILIRDTRLHLGFVLALVCAAAVWFVMNRTTTGFEMRLTGLNRRAAYCVGMPVTKSLIMSACLSGGLAGLAGMGEVLGVQHRLLEGISGGNGYTALLVALLAQNNPVLVVVISVVLAALQVGAGSMQRMMGVPSSIVSILTGMIVLLVLCRDIFKRYKEFKAGRKAVAK